MNDTTSAVVAVEQQRAIAEIESALTIAQRFPRDEDKALANIVRACESAYFAETAIYSYPRGKTVVEGLSVRMAEHLARNWGNCETAVVELGRMRDQEGSYSQVLTYCWDMETNNKEKRVFNVRHKRDTKGGGYALSSERDIYELIANQAARRKRACILAVIPPDVQQKALDACNKSMLKSLSDAPLIEVINNMLLAFEELGVSKPMIEERLGHQLETCRPIEVVGLKKVFRSLKDQIARTEDFFESKAPVQKRLAQKRQEDKT